MYIAKLKLLILSALCLAVSGLSSCGNNCSTDDRYLVVTTYAGMGNRLRNVASAQIMASITDRKLVVDWLHQPGEMPGKWTDFFSNPLVVFEDSGLANQGCRLKDLQNAKSGDDMIRNLGLQNDANLQKELEKIPDYNEPIVYFGSTAEYRPREKDLSPADYKKRYRQFFQSLVPTKWINDEVEKFKKKHHFENFYMVGVHYRGWNAGHADTTNPALIRDPSDRYVPEFIAKMKEVLARPLSSTDNKPVAFFLASDSEAARSRIVATPELQGKVFFRTEEVERSSVRGQQSAMVDFFLIAQEFVMGTAQSSFSEQAAILTNRDKVNIGNPAYQ